MSCTFWNMRRRKAALAAKEAAKEAEPVKTVDENEAEKKPAKKGGGKRGK